MLSQTIHEELFDMNYYAMVINSNWGNICVALHFILVVYVNRISDRRKQGLDKEHDPLLNYGFLYLMLKKIKKSHCI